MTGARITITDIAHLATVDVPTAGRVFGLGRDASYAAAGRGEIPVLRFGRSLRVPVPKLLELLGITPETTEASPASTAGEPFALIKSDAASDLDPAGAHHNDPPAA